MLGFTLKLMGISSNVCNAHFICSTGQDRKIILVSKSGVDHLLTTP